MTACSSAPTSLDWLGRPNSPGSPVIASGGVSGLADIVALAAIENLGGIITGKAVYEGRFTVAEALDALATLDAGGMGTP